MTGLQQFWLRLTSLQKISLISLALVLLALPAGLYLTGQSQEIRKKAAGELVCPPRGYQRICTGNQAGCPSDAGEAEVKQCNSEGTGWGNSFGECRDECGDDRDVIPTPGPVCTPGVIRSTCKGSSNGINDSKCVDPLAAWSVDEICNGEGTGWFTGGADCGCWLADVAPTPTPGGGTQPSPGASPTPTPKPNPPTATISGPTAGKTGEAMAFSAKAQGKSLQWTRIHWAKATSDLTQGPSWTMVSENTNCKEARTDNECTVNGNFTPQEAGEYYLAVTANNPGGPCSGNPKVAEITGWTDCGANSRVKVSVTGATKQEGQTLNLSTGYNLVGLSVDKSNYKAADFVKDLNSSFTGGTNKILYIFRYDAGTGVWESYPAIKNVTMNNFPVLPWEAYWVYSKSSGTSKIPGVTLPLPDTIRIPAGWSLWSAPTSLSDIPDAKTLLAKATGQGIDLKSIWKWDAGAKQYIGHRAGQSENNFSLVAGVGYWIYNGGVAKDFSLVTTPLPPPPPGN